MNNQRRKQLRGVIETLNIMKDSIESVRDEEQETFDNMPENLQMSERAMTSENAIEALEEALDSLDNVLDRLEEVL